MSERYERSFSDRSLLMETPLSSASSVDEREALAEYQRIVAQSSAANRRRMELNEKIKELCFSGQRDSEECKRYQAEAKECVELSDRLDKQAARILENKLRPLSKKAFNIAANEELQRGAAFLAQMNQREQEHYERVAQNWHINRARAEINRDQKAKEPKSKELSLLENEIGTVRKQVRQLEEDIGELKFCWFGTKRTYKKQLIAERDRLHDRLLVLYERRRILESGR